YYIKNPSVNLNDTPTTQAYKDITIPDKRALATVHVYPNELDHIFFEPDISNPNKRYEVVKRRSLPVKAYGYDFRGNMITPIEYSESPGWTASAGELKDEMKSATHLMSIFTATESLNPLAGTPIPVDLTVKAQANFKKLSAPKDANIRKTGVIIKKEEKGYLAVVNFGLFDFPCIYQELDKDKLDKNGEYELSFLYTSGNNSSDSRPAHAYVGIAYMRNADAGSVPDSEIHMLYSGPLNSGGKISGRPFKLRFKIDSLAAANDGKTNGVNNLDDAKKILVFLGAPKSDAERPALRYDHVTIERVK
ncbi:MAG TPA: hypothetical protein PKL57_12325, partial [Candidatus Wallbacteria bacterium]|nr:hypothetical protein [Candidatus Wallbacteria bacterium]